MRRRPIIDKRKIYASFSIVFKDGLSQSFRNKNAKLFYKNYVNNGYRIIKSLQFLFKIDLNKQIQYG